MAHVTVTVTVTPVGPIPASDLETKVTAVPRDTSLELAFGNTLTSDATSINGEGQVVRTFEFLLSALYVALFPNPPDQKGPYFDYMRQTIATAVRTKALGDEPVIS